MQKADHRLIYNSHDASFVNNIYGYKNSVMPHFTGFNLHLIVTNIQINKDNGNGQQTQRHFPKILPIHRNLIWECILRSKNISCSWTNKMITDKNSIMSGMSHLQSFLKKPKNRNQQNNCTSIIRLSTEPTHFIDLFYPLGSWIACVSALFFYPLQVKVIHLNPNCIDE